MELREYLHILLKRAWLILPLTFIALVASLWFSYQQTPIYEATSTYVTRLGSDLASADSDTLIYGIETLAGRERIFVTYCEVMTSQSVRERAFELLSLNPNLKEFEDYKILCSNLPETNVLLLTVQGSSTELVLRLNMAIGLAGMERANPLYTSFPIENLDPPKLEKDPISPQTTRNGVLGGLLGLVVGVTLALTFEYLRSPSERLEAVSIRNLQVGTYNERYFRQRFDEEINRPYAKLRPMSLALLRLTPNEEFNLLPENAQTDLLRRAALTIQDTMRQRSDIIAYLEPWTFGILLTETPGDEARSILSKLHSEIRARPFEQSGYMSTFVATTGIVASSGGTMDYRQMLKASEEALADAETRGENTVHVVATTPKPFVMGGDAPPGADKISDSGSVFNVTEAELFGNATDEGSGANWRGDLNDYSGGSPATNGFDETDKTSIPPRLRNSLLTRAMKRQENQHEDTESEANHTPKDTNEEPGSGR